MIDAENNGLSSSATKPKHIVTPIIVKDSTVSFSELNEVVYYQGNAKDSILDEAEAKSRCSTLKRVSFGSSPETNVETFVYERIPDDYPVESRHCYLSPPPPSSPTKVRVELRDTQLPCSIEPPSEIGLILADGTVTPAASLANNSLLLSKSNVVLSTTVVPPQIPSRKKMEDHENPFRLDGSLRTEVEPIVEGFKKKPFHAPADQEQSMIVRDHMSPSTIIDLAHSSEITDSKGRAVPLSFTNDNLAQIRPSSENLVESVDGVATTSKKRPSASSNGTQTVAAESPKAAAAVANLLKNDSQKNSADVEHKVLVSPRVGQVEMVHLEEDDAKKKRCGNCCVVQ